MLSFKPARFTPFVITVLAAGCAAPVRTTRPSPPPPPTPALTATPPPRPAPPEPAVPPEIKITPLPWVNPARCLPVCAMDPGPRLVRVDRQGRPDAKGPVQ